MDDGYILITGAAGMIGSGIVRYLQDQARLLLVDDLVKPEQWKNLLDKRFHRLLGIRELFPFLEKQPQEVRAILHLGACSDTLETRGDYLMENNYTYSIRLAEYALKHHMRFIYASSAATYGDGRLGFSDALDLLPRLKPLNLYGFSKHLFDLWVVEQGVQEHVVGLKYFNIFGPNESHKEHMASMVYKMFPHVRDEGVLDLFASTDPSQFGDGEQKRDFLYVKDAVRLTCEFLHHEQGGIYNIGQGKATSWNVLAKAVFSALDKEPKIRYIPMPEHLAKQYQNYTCAEMDKLIACRTKAGLLGNHYTFSVEDAVKEYVQQYLMQGARW